MIINKGKTKMEGAADLVFRDSIGKVLGKMDGETIPVELHEQGF